MFKNLLLTPMSINLEYRISLLILSNALVKSMKARHKSEDLLATVHDRMPCNTNMASVVLYPVL